MGFEFPDQIISDQLSNGEQLLWSGKPRQGLLLRPMDALVIPFSLFWCGFAIFWEHGVIKDGAPLFMALWGIPFVLMGLFFVFGRFWADAQLRSRMYYGLTNQRIIIVSGIFSRQVKSLNLNTLTNVSLTERANGSGDISFGPGSSGAWNQRNPWMPQYDQQLYAIENARDVYERIRTAQAAV